MSKGGNRLGAALGAALIVLCALSFCVPRGAAQAPFPVATSLNAKGTILDTHELSVGVVGTYSRRCANQMVASADLIFYIGSHTGSQVTNNWTVPARRTQIVQLDIAPGEIGRNYANTLPVCGDAKVTLVRMLALP